MAYYKTDIVRIVGFEEITKVFDGVHHSFGFILYGLIKLNGQGYKTFNWKLTHEEYRAFRILYNIDSFVGKRIEVVYNYGGVPEYIKNIL